MAKTGKYKYLDPEALLRLGNLTLAARLVVEGYFSGMHRSPYRGFSIEFAEHREYTPGIDPRHIDWRVFGRIDKLYVKQYEEETNLRCYLLVDKSASMAYKHSAGISKLEYASYLAASLAYMMVLQQDSVGLITYDSVVQQHLPPRQGRRHMRVLLEQLENISSGGETSLSETFHQLAETIKRRALVIVLSDLLDDAKQIMNALQHFRHKKHEVIVIQVLDPAELNFPFKDVSAIIDMETKREVPSDPLSFRRTYLEEMNRFLLTIRGGCQDASIDYALAETSKPYGAFLGNYLARRDLLTR